MLISFENEEDKQLGTLDEIEEGRNKEHDPTVIDLFESEGSHNKC